MAKAKQLSKKQLRLIESLSASKLRERTILARHKIGRQLFHRWLADARFCEELNQVVAEGYRQSTLMLARNAPTAAKKLIKLTKCKKEETARKACMDIITMKPPTFQPAASAARDDNTKESAPISPETASRILSALAEERE